MSDTDSEAWVNDDENELDRQFPELGVTLACVAENDGGASWASCCPIIQRLSLWNRVLWHAGFQLRELAVPGELSLVRVAHEGLQREERSHEVRLLFHVLLAWHKCVVRVDLDDVLVEGSELGEFREFVSAALRYNTSVRSLNLMSLFWDYRFIQEDVFNAIVTMSHLRELVISATSNVDPSLEEFLCSVLNSACLSTLSISGLRFHAGNSERLLGALQARNTVADLSVHVSILYSRNSSNVPLFSCCLQGSTSLSSLTLEGSHFEPEETLRELSFVCDALLMAGTLQKLKLSNFLLDCGCARMFSRLLAQQDGKLQHLDISGCRWALDCTLNAPAATIDYDQPGNAYSEGDFAWLQPLGDFAEVKLSFLSISLQGLKPDDFNPIFVCAAIVESLGPKALVVHDVLPDALPEVWRAVREAGIEHKVSIVGEYLINSEVIDIVEEFREALPSVIVSVLAESSLQAFCKTVHRVRSWKHVTSLRLLLSQEAMGDVFMMWSLCCYLNEATVLREFEVCGFDAPDLSTCLAEATENHSFLLEAMFSNAALRTVRIREVRLGEVNLSYVIDTILHNETLSELDFSSWDSSENDSLFCCIAADIDVNKTLLRFRVPCSVYNETEAEKRAEIEAVLSDNTGFVTCSADYVVRYTEAPYPLPTDSNRCYEALTSIPKSLALIDKVRQLAALDEAEAASWVCSVLCTDST
ncbi:hypothetical protein HPB50_000658 [Hyalomma asiaticum]|uniref:Uncharacterized protein n=1 Tax=Hyalomma asiaticum TaxID=266040 RepID=A0ACB7T564_HYAAI|nr:hypothetical protein HPB50_000658 [Hyalomma asiaticum]